MSSSFFTVYARPRFVIFLLAGSLFFVVYHFVPSVHTCHSRLRWTYEEHSTTAWCDSPEFSIVCWPGSKYSKQVGTEVLCRTPKHRPIKIVVASKVERQRCIAEMGWLAAYDSAAKECYCDYHSVEQHGLCLMTDEVCQTLLGSLAFATDLGTGMVDQCRCPEGYALGAKCDAP